MQDRWILKGLGFIFLLFVLLSTLAFSAEDIGIGATSNDTDMGNDTNGVKQAHPAASCGACSRRYSLAEF